MFCPNCGANNSTEQKFCRQCGLSLEKSAESLLEQLPTAKEANLLRHEKAVERFGNFALGGLGVVGIISITALLFYLVQKLIASGTNVYIGILLVAFLVFAGLSLAFVIFNESIKEKKAKLNRRASELESARETGKLLEAKPFVPAASVIENSTELLLTKNKTRKFE